MYKSPIETMIADIQHQIAVQQDEEIYKAVVSVGINVDKEELIRALQYDRGQYEKGYADAKAELVPCKDCYKQNTSWCPMDSKRMRVTGFCSYGERRNDV